MKRLFPLQRMVKFDRNRDGKLFYLIKSGRGLTYSGNIYTPIVALLIEFPLFVLPYYIISEFIPWFKCCFFNKHTSWSPSTKGYISCYICNKWLGWDEKRLKQSIYSNEKIKEYKQQHETKYISNGGYVD